MYESSQNFHFSPFPSGKNFPKAIWTRGDGNNNRASCSLNRLRQGVHKRGAIVTLTGVSLSTELGSRSCQAISCNYRWFHVTTDKGWGLHSKVEALEGQLCLAPDRKRLSNVSLLRGLQPSAWSGMRDLQLFLRHIDRNIGEQRSA
jgi:hypothetical protein